MYVSKSAGQVREMSEMISLSIMGEKIPRGPSIKMHLNAMAGHISCKLYYIKYKLKHIELGYIDTKVTLKYGYGL